MSQQLWTAVDDYICDRLIPRDEILEGALERSTAAGLPPIGVTPAQGKLLQLLARGIGARAILELGTLGGYSTIWLARALPADGRLVTLELNVVHADVARANIVEAGLAGVVDVRVGPALESLSRLIAEGAGPFDLIFLDADKVSYADYLPWMLKLAHPGTFIVADNIVRNGAVSDAASADPSVRGVRRFNDLMANDPRLSATVIQTVGQKGYDGFALAIVTA